MKNKNNNINDTKSQYTNCETRQLLLFHYKLLLEKDSNIDSKSLHFWEKQINSGLSTIDDFINDTINTLEYKDKITTKFRQLYYDLIDVKLSLNHIKDFQAFFKNQEVHDKDLFLYIVYLPNYEQKYNNIIHNMYLKTLHNSDMIMHINHDDSQNIENEENVLEIQKYYLEKFRFFPNYDLDQLADDMMKKEHERDYKENIAFLEMIKKEKLKSYDAQDNNKKENLLKNLKIHQEYILEPLKDKLKNGIKKNDTQKSINDKHHICETNNINRKNETDQSIDQKDNYMNIFTEGYIRLKNKERFNDDISDYYVDLTKECFFDPSKLTLKFKQLEKLQHTVKELESKVEEYTKYKKLIDEHDLVKKNKKNQNTLLIKLNKESVESFESTYKRPMFVQEYFKYIVENESENPHIPFLKIFNSFCENYNKTRTLLHDFTNIKLSEYDFVKQYLYAVDDPAFYTKVIDHIVLSKEYKAQMCIKISQLYSELFNESLKEHDIEYVFLKILEKKLYLHHEEINEILVDLKSETDNIISHIFTQYEKVLQRQPDVYEIDELVKEYRLLLPDKRYEEIDLETEKKLILSLEFHDVIKNKFKSALPSIKPRILFDYLRFILEGLEEENFSSIEKKLENIIKNHKND